MSTTAPDPHTQDEQTLAQVEALRAEANQAHQIGDLESLTGSFIKEFEESEQNGGSSSPSSSSSTFVTKIKNLTSTTDNNPGFSQIRRCRRDGNCFYRCFLFGLFNKVAASQQNSNSNARKRIESKVLNALEHCVSAGYDRFAIEDMDEFVRETLQELFGGFGPKVGRDESSNGPETVPIINDVEKIKQLPDAILKLFREDDMNYPLCWLRCITSSVMKKDKDNYLPFLDGKSVDEFCMLEIDPLYREADQPQVQALCSYFNQPVRIFYLDQSQSLPGQPEGSQKCVVYNIEGAENYKDNESSGSDSEAPIDLLYRPGHYELLYK